jgi:ankyrin repeat protein
VSQLIEKHPDILHEKDDQGRTPLRHACQAALESGSYGIGRLRDAIKHMAERGASFNEPDNEGVTPLHAIAGAGMSGTSLFYHAMQEHGGDITVKDSNGQTPLHYICKYSENADWHDILKDAIRTAIDHGADLNAADNQGRTPTDLLPDELCLNPGARPAEDMKQFAYDYEKEVQNMGRAEQSAPHRSDQNPPANDMDR